MDAPESRTRQIPGVPKEAAAILETTFQRILAEATFADAWTLGSDSPEDEPLSSTDLKLVVPLAAPWNGSILIGASEETARDLAAGFHSLPDAMVDRALALEFLAELAEMLARDLFCASEMPVETRQPFEPRQESVASMWAQALGSRTFLGCNGTGRILAALIATTE